MDAAAAVRRRPQPSDARREQHEPAEQQRFLNKSAPPPPLMPPPPEPSKGVATSKGGRDVIAAQRLGVRSTAPAPRKRCVRIRALMRRGDGVLVW